MNIEVVGWYGKSNCGDEAFRAAHCLAFRNHNLSFITPPRKTTDKADLVVLGGGAVISPFYMASLENAKCPKHALGVSISWDSEMDLLDKYGIQSCYLRDEADVEACRQRTKAKVDYTPDLAFLYHPTGGDILSRYQKHPNRRPLGVMVTDYVNPALDRDINVLTSRANQFKVTMAEKLDKMSSDGWEVFLIPLSTGGYGDDRRMNLDIAAFMKKTPTNILDTLSPQDTIDLVSQMDLAICQKFHAHIFSIIAGTPFVSIALTRKVKMLLDGHNLQKTTCAWFPNQQTFDASDFAKVVKEVVSEQDYYKKLFLDTSGRYYRRVHDVIDTVRRDWLQESC